MKLDIEQKKIVKRLSRQYGLTEREIIEIITSPFDFIRQEIKSIEINGDETKEEFESKVKNFNIPRIGKLYGNYNNLKMLQKHGNRLGKKK
jgi:hypothetical protein